MRKTLDNQRAALGLPALCFGALCAVLVGCAAPRPPVQASVAQPVATPSLSFEYRQPLVDGELRDALEMYWRTHVSRDWAKLYGQEFSATPISEKFYVAYHARAWPVRHVAVLGTKPVADTEVEVTLQVRFENPDNGRPHTDYRHERWRKVQGKWRHVVTDPMLIQFTH